MPPTNEQQTISGQRSTIKESMTDPRARGARPPIRHVGITSGEDQCCWAWESVQKRHIVWTHQGRMVL